LPQAFAETSLRVLGGWLCDVAQGLLAFAGSQVPKVSGQSGNRRQSCFSEQPPQHMFGEPLSMSVAHTQIQWLLLAVLATGANLCLYFCDAFARS
jgi:hypothetical protein